MAVKLLIVLSKEKKHILMLEHRPATLGELGEALRTKFSIEDSFRLQYFDKEFDAYIDLEDVRDVVHLSILKIVWGSPWPHPFPLPQFGPDVEQTLVQVDEMSLLRPSLKRRMLQAIVNTIYSLKTDPTSTEIASVAMALVYKYPKIRYEAGRGHEPWAIAISKKFKELLVVMQKLRAKEVPLS